MTRTAENSRADVVVEVACERADLEAGFDDCPLERGLHAGSARAEREEDLGAWAREALDRTLEAKLTLAALAMALSRRSVKAGLVHHSDRGVQYAADDYTGLLDRHGIQISMSRKGNPYDNARTESFMKTLKYEEVYRQEYRDLPDALRSLRRFMEKVYNEKRLHSALGYLPPSEFETNLVVTNHRTEAAARQLSL